MERGELPAVIGIFLIIFLLVLTFAFRGTDNFTLSWIVFLGANLAGVFFVYVITSSEVEWVKVVSKAFFIIPLLIAISFLFYYGINMSYDVS
jgi:hypothetical protein